MKKILCLILSLFMVLAVTGCGVADKFIDGAQSAIEDQINGAISNVISDIEDQINDAISGITDEFDITSDDSSYDNSTETSDETSDEGDSTEELLIDEFGTYDSKEEVALFIHTYGRLPDNYITKKEAQELGWEGGSVEKFAPGKCIGGSSFGNYEGLLPEEDGRTYKECDIDTLGASTRGAKRIVYSNDGLIYYTDDHYESFTLLYDEE